MALAEQGIGVHVLGHPVVPLTRDKAGKLAGVGEGTRESFMHLEIDRQPQATRWRRSKSRVREVLDDVRAMRRRLGRRCATSMLAVAEELPTRTMPVSDAGRAEAQEFLRWAADDHFTFLGYREYDGRQKQGKDEMLRRRRRTRGLGLLRGKDARQAASADVARRALHAAVRVRSTR